MDGRGSVKKQGQEALLAWCQEKTRKHPQWIAQEVQDFGRSWHDGLAFTVLLCSIAPNVSRDFDLEPCLALSRSDPKKLLAKVFAAAKGLGIAALLEPEDLIGETAEASSETVVMYISQFYRFEQAKIQEQKHKSVARESVRFTKPEPASSSSSSHSRATAAASGVFVGPGDESQRPKCVICAKPVGGNTVEYGKAVYHKECFCCFKCNTPITGRCTNIQGRPHCTACGKENFNNKFTISTLKNMPVMGAPMSSVRPKLAAQTMRELGSSSSISPAAPNDDVLRSTVAPGELTHVTKSRPRGPQSRRNPTLRRMNIDPSVASIGTIKDPRASSRSFANIPVAAKQSVVPIKPVAFEKTQPTRQSRRKATITMGDRVESPRSRGITLGSASSSPNSSSSNLLSSSSPSSNVVSPSSPLADSAPIPFLSNEELEASPLQISEEELVRQEIERMERMKKELGEGVSEVEAKSSPIADSVKTEIGDWILQKEKVYKPITVDDLQIDENTDPEQVEQQIQILHQKHEEDFRKSKAAMSWMSDLNEQKIRRLEEVEALNARRIEEERQAKDREYNLIKERLEKLENIEDDPQGSSSSSPFVDSLAEAEYESGAQEMGEIQEEEVVAYVWEERMCGRLEGFLLKQSSKKKSFGVNWQRRWFTLQGDNLVYYREQQQNIFGSERPPDGIISIRHAGKIVQVDPYTDNPRNNHFQIVCKERVYSLRADTRADMEIWVRYLNEARTFYENQVETFSPSLALSLGEHSGTLEKLGRFNKWNQRFFILKDGVLFRFKSEYGSREQMGKLALFGAQLSEYMPHKYDRCFQVLSPARPKDIHILRAPTVEDMHIWLNAILKHKILIEESINSIIIM